MYSEVVGIPAAPGILTVAGATANAGVPAFCVISDGADTDNY